jgi:hypothetical protein
MTSDLLRELGESRRPGTDEPPAQVRQRLMSTMRANDGRGCVRRGPRRLRAVPGSG